MSTIKLAKLKTSRKNPRVIKDARFEKLKESIQQFSKMMELRPIITDEKDNILAGRQRYAALIDLGYTEIPREWVKKATELTDEEKNRFSVLDNEHYGDWDYQALAADWDKLQLADWGLDLSFPDTTTTVAFTASKTQKGTVVKVICSSTTEANALAEELIKRKLNVEIK